MSTQKERVLSMLKDAGPKGVRSDRFYEAHLPRAAARIQELKDAGEPISTEREGKFVRYFHKGAALASPSAQSPQITVQGGATAPSQRSAGDASAEPDEGTIELGGDGRPNPKQGPTTVAQTPQLGQSLFESEEVKQRPLSAFTDAEAA